jgi:hypothetical protein
MVEIRKTIKHVIEIVKHQASVQNTKIVSNFDVMLFDF